MRQTLSPFIINCFNDESQCRADGINVFIHNPLNNRRLARIIETASTESISLLSWVFLVLFFFLISCIEVLGGNLVFLAYSSKIRISLSSNLALRKIDSMFGFKMLAPQNVDLRV